MPNEIYAWESEKFAACAKMPLALNLRGALPEDDLDGEGFMTLYYMGVNVHGNNADEYAEREAEFNRFRQKDENGVLRFPSGWFNPPQGVTDDNGVNATNNLFSQLGILLRRQAEKRGDARIKTFYQDFAYLAELDNRSYAQMQANSPYICKLSPLYIELTNPKVLSSAEQKAGMGLPLYEASYDLLHSVTGEIRVEETKQRLDREGWTPENTQNYMKELLAAHNDVLTQYGKFSVLYDSPQNTGAKFLGNPIAHTFGRGEHENRNINASVGMIRGEKQAIENGWGKDDLCILGALGAIEEEIWRYEKYGSAEVKASMPEFKSAFMKLKQECYYKHVGSARQKGQIAFKILEFVDARCADDASPASKVCTTFAGKNIRAKLAEAQESIQAESNKELETETYDEKTMLQNPTERLQRIAGEAANTGDYRHMILEHLYMSDRVEASFDKNDPIRVQYYRTADEIFGANNPHAKEIAQALAEVYFEKIVEYTRVAEQLAADIREGRQPVDEQYENIKKDYCFSIRYANHLLKDEPINKGLQEITGLYTDYAYDLDDNPTLKEWRDNFIENATDGLTYAERTMYLNKGHKYSTLLFAENDNQLVEALRNTGKKLDQTEKKMEVGLNSAKKHFSTIDTLAAAKPTARYKKGAYVNANNPEVAVDPGKCNSQAFMNMYNALEDINKRSSSQVSPKELLDAYNRLDKASKAYEDKINSQFFAGISENGRKRKQLSKDLQKFAKEQIEALRDLPENVNFDKSIENQKNELFEVNQSNKERLKPSVQEKINQQVEAQKEQKLTDYNDNESFEQNRERLVNGVASLIVLTNMDKVLNGKPGKLLCENDVSEDNISKGVREITSKNQQFIAMAKDIKTPEDYNKIKELAKDNPRMLLDHLNKYSNKAPAQEHRDNNIIQQSAPVKGMF